MPQIQGEMYKIEFTPTNGLEIPSHQKESTEIYIRSKLKPIEQDVAGGTVRVEYDSLDTFGLSFQNISASLQAYIRQTILG